MKAARINGVRVIRTEAPKRHRCWLPGGRARRRMGLKKGGRILCECGLTWEWNYWEWFEVSYPEPPSAQAT